MFANRPPSGFMPIPGSKLGGYRKKQGAKWVYWYPNKGVQTRLEELNAETGPLWEPKNKKLKEAGVIDVGTKTLKHASVVDPSVWLEALIDPAQSTGISVLTDAKGMQIETKGLDPATRGLGEPLAPARVYRSLDHSAHYLVVAGAEPGTVSIVRMLPSTNPHGPDYGVRTAKNVPLGIVQGLMARWEHVAKLDDLPAGVNPDEAYPLDTDASGEWETEKDLFGPAGVEAVIKAPFMLAVSLATAADKLKTARKAKAEQASQLKAAKAENAPDKVAAAEALGEQLDEAQEALLRYGETYKTFRAELKKAVDDAVAKRRASGGDKEVLTIGEIYATERAFYESPRGRELLTALNLSDVDVSQAFSQFIPGHKADPSKAPPGSTAASPGVVGSTGYQMIAADGTLTLSDMESPEGRQALPPKVREMLSTMAKRAGGKITIPVPGTMGVENAGGSSTSISADYIAAATGLQPSAAKEWLRLSGYGAIFEHMGSFVADAEMFQRNGHFYDDGLEVKGNLPKWEALGDLKSPHLAITETVVEKMRALRNTPDLVARIYAAAGDPGSAETRLKSLQLVDKVEETIKALENWNIPDKIKNAVPAWNEDTSPALVAWLRVLVGRKRGNAGSMRDTYKFEAPLRTTNDLAILNAARTIITDALREMPWAGEKLISDFEDPLRKAQSDLAKVAVPAGHAAPAFQDAQRSKVDKLILAATSRTFVKSLGVKARPAMPSASGDDAPTLRGRLLDDLARLANDPKTQALRDAQRKFFTAPDGRRYIEDNFGFPDLTPEYKALLGRAAVAASKLADGDLSHLTQTERVRSFDPSLPTDVIHDYLDAVEKLTAENVISVHYPDVAAWKSARKDYKRAHAVLTICATMQGKDENDHANKGHNPERIFRFCPMPESAVVAHAAGGVVTFPPASFSRFQFTAAVNDVSTDAAKKPVVYVIENPKQGIGVEGVSRYASEQEVVVAGSYVVSHVHTGTRRNHPTLHALNDQDWSLNNKEMVYVTLREMTVEEKALMGLAKGANADDEFARWAVTLGMLADGARRGAPPLYDPTAPAYDPLEIDEPAADTSALGTLASEGPLDKARDYALRRARLRANPTSLAGAPRRSV